MTAQWKNVSAYDLGSKHLARTVKIVFADGSIISGLLLGVAQRLRQNMTTYDHVTVATVSIAENDEHFELAGTKSISVLEDGAES